MLKSILFGMVLSVLMDLASVAIIGTSATIATYMVVGVLCGIAGGMVAAMIVYWMGN